MRTKRLRSVLSLTALLAVTVTGLEAGSVIGGSAVAMAATVDDPPPVEEPPTGEPPAGQAPVDEVPVEEPHDAAEDPVPPGTYRYVPPPDPDAPLPEEPGAEPAVPEEPVPEEPLPPTAVPGPGPGRGTPMLQVGNRGHKVKVLQVRLQRVKALKTPVTGIYGTPTQNAVKRFQAKVGFAITGVVDGATWGELLKRAGPVSFRDIAAGEDRPYGSRVAASCLTGRVVCVDKTARTVRWVVDGHVVMTLDARFGADSTPTREGVFAIQYKDRDHVSKLYGSSMPFALFFSGGQAVHYSSDFAARGYYGASHGCVNTRQYKKMEKLFGLAQIGDRVVVYRSRAVKG